MADKSSLYQTFRSGGGDFADFRFIYLIYHQNMLKPSIDLQKNIAYYRLLLLFTASRKQQHAHKSQHLCFAKL